MGDSSTCLPSPSTRVAQKRVRSCHDTNLSFVHKKTKYAKLAYMPSHIRDAHTHSCIHTNAHNL